jgi:hypothetical protein
VIGPALNTEQITAALRACERGPEPDAPDGAAWGVGGDAGAGDDVSSGAAAALRFAPATRSPPSSRGSATG